MERLSSERLYRSNNDLDLSMPRYNRAQKCGIVHLGTGAFHRAHQAVYFDALLRAGYKDWMIQGASLRSARVSEQLNPQDGLYTVIERADATRKHNLIGSIKSVLSAPDEPHRLIDAMADPHVSLITLTVTEKGYRPALATGGLDMNDPDTVHDLANPDQPRTALGFIVAALARRMTDGAPPVTILSCDNMPENGETTRRGVLALASESQPELAAWIDHACAFPSSMVDRIVPATTELDISELCEQSGYRDDGMVRTEPFSQWVVEDWFFGRRPPLEKVGVQLTKDVAAWEKAKLRMLNAAHSALAYFGGLAGHEYIHEAISAPGFEAFVNQIWDEAETTLDPVEGFDAHSYRSDLTRRFKNSALNHRTYQIAMDGSQKLPQRCLNSIRARRTMGLDSPALVLTVAAWMLWQSGLRDTGDTFTVDDPISDQTSQLITAHGDDVPSLVKSFLKLEAVFIPELSEDEKFVQALTLSYAELSQEGAGAWLKDKLGDG